METERTLMESSMCSIVSGGDSEGEEERMQTRRGTETSRRRRRLPKIPKNKKRKLILASTTPIKRSCLTILIHDYVLFNSFQLLKE